MRNIAILALGAIITLALYTGCVKLQNKVIMKGEWELVNFQLENSPDNLMEGILQGYNQPPGCCKYMIDFQDGDKVVGTYYVNDTISYTVEGNWSLDDKSELYIKLDDYVDGLFTIDRQSRREYQLKSDKNLIELLPGSPFETPTTLDIRRRDI